jgi:hypothetical protein
MVNKIGIYLWPAALMLFSSCVHHKGEPNLDQSTSVSKKIERQPSSELAETPWTTWYNGSTIGGLYALKHIRDYLLVNSLHDPYVSYAGLSPVDCTEKMIRFRTADGKCNDLKSPHVGSAGAAFGRNAAPGFIDQDAMKKIAAPDPALVSKEFFTRDEFKPVPFLNMLAAVWIQFMNHDWLSHGRNMDDNPYVFKSEDGTRSKIERTKENSQAASLFKKGFGRVSINEVTHWWDASQLYGSSQQELDQLRSFSRGKMRMEVVNGREVLPRDHAFNPLNNKQAQGVELTGFRDNWWLGLSMLHTLFVKEHNAIAEQLLKNHAIYNPSAQRWTWRNGSKTLEMDERQLDEQIFQTARLINAAVLAKIHTVEWTPAVLPNKVLKKAMFANWYGLANPTTWLGSVAKELGLGADPFPDSDLGYIFGGIVGQKTDNYGVPFSITEEFTSVYRLHSLLPENLDLRTLKDKQNVTPVHFSETRNEKAYERFTEYEMKDLFYSFGTQLPGQLVLNNFPSFMQNLEIPGRGKIDLGMVDIVRDRERSVPRYNQFRRAIGLKPIRSYRDFFPAQSPLDARQQEIIAKFERVYGFTESGSDNVEMIDLLVGTLAEEVRPTNFGFGETLFQIFIVMASRRLMADRFFTEYYKADYYTTTGLKWIDKEGWFGRVVTRHMPELGPHVKGLEHAFLPWKQ